jgi:tetratricopeptide (TPR) repeat protein
LAGLSVSPVIATIITSIIGAVVALISTLSGVKPQVEIQKDESGSTSSPRWQVNPIPLACLIVGIVAGSVVGIWARNQNWLGTNLQTEVQQWATMGIPEQDIVQRLFEQHYPQDASSKTEERPSSQTVLRGDETVQSLTNAGIDYEKQGKQHDAMEMYRKAISPAAEPMNYLAWLRQEQGNFEEALPLAQVAVMMKPDDADAIDTLAVILCKTGQNQDAVRWMERAADIQPQRYQQKLGVFQSGNCQ